jgi:hypothetical protein
VNTEYKLKLNDNAEPFIQITEGDAILCIYSDNPAFEEALKKAEVQAFNRKSIKGLKKRVDKRLPSNKRKKLSNKLADLSKSSSEKRLFALIKKTYIDNKK